jgi:hypothetical protein
MPKKASTAGNGQALVIVESPAKARTIGKLLGKGYRVEASIGHVRDLPQGAKQVPAQYKGEPWANLGVNVEDNFTPMQLAGISWSCSSPRCPSIDSCSTRSPRTPSKRRWLVLGKSTRAW